MLDCNFNREGCPAINFTLEFYIGLLLVAGPPTEKGIQPEKQG